MRELIRSRLGGNLRAKQRAVVQAFIANYEADGGWAAQSVIGQYANDALRLHSESCLMDVLQECSLCYNSGRSDVAGSF